MATLLNKTQLALCVYYSLTLKWPISSRKTYSVFVALWPNKSGLNSAYKQFVTICQPSITNPGGRDEGGNSAGVCLQHAEIKKTKQNTTTAAAFLRAGGCISVCTFFPPSKTMTASEHLLLLSSKKQQFEKLNRSAISAMFYLFTFFLLFHWCLRKEFPALVWWLWRKGFLKVSFLLLVWSCHLIFFFKSLFQCFSVWAAQTEWLALIQLRQEAPGQDRRVNVA